LPVRPKKKHHFAGGGGKHKRNTLKKSDEAQREGEKGTFNTGGNHARDLESEKKVKRGRDRSEKGKIGTRKGKGQLAWRGCIKEVSEKSHGDEKLKKKAGRHKRTNGKGM